MKLSIITINRNNVLGLRKTIESVISQTFTDFEYIVIDGASTDGSVEIIKEFSDRIDYWVSEPDKGIYNAMNKGILKAKGEYCLFLNSGDWLVENILNTINLQYFSCDIVYGNIIVEYKNGLKSIRKGCAKSDLTFFDFYNDTISHQAAFISKKLLMDNGLYDENFKIIADWFFFIKVVVWENASVKYVDVNISHFDAFGIGGTVDARYESRKALESILPEKILKDYEVMYKQKTLINELMIELKRYKNRFYYFDLLISKIKSSIRKVCNNL